MLRRLARAVGWSDAVLIVVAALNLLNIWRAVAVSRGSWSIAWYAIGAPVWALAPSRLLLAALLMAPRRWWTEVAAAIFSAHVCLSMLFYYLAPDYLAQEWRIEPTVFELPAFQAALAAVLLVFALIRLARRLKPGRLLTAFKATTAAILVVGLVGYTSNVISQPAAEREVARYIYRNLPAGRQHVAALDQRSFARFREIGVQATCPEPACGPIKWQDITEPREWAQAAVYITIGVAPFLLEVGYRYGPDDRDYRQSRALVFGFFGKTVLLQPDSDLMFRAYPYLSPW